MCVFPRDTPLPRVPLLSRFLYFASCFKKSLFNLHALLILCP